VLLHRLYHGCLSPIHQELEALLYSSAKYYIWFVTISQTLPPENEGPNLLNNNLELTLMILN
jgi:hypothetical protein